MENNNNSCKVQMQKAPTRAIIKMPKPPSCKTTNTTSNEESQVTTTTTTATSAYNDNKKKHEQMKLAALAISFNVRLRSSDMPLAMQERAIRHARALLDSSVSRRPNPTLLARSLKKEFDSVYGPAWHCVAGKSFGSFVTHSPGGFVYFSVEALSFLLFKTEVHVVPKKEPSPTTC